jgi:osmotically-inducible protein OsmY
MSGIRDARARARARARFRPLLLCAALLCAAPLAGCGSSEEARIEELTEELKALRAGLGPIRAQVAEREATAKTAQDALAAARNEARESETRIAEIEKELGTFATDPVLFRMVQKGLLDDDDLEDVAIAARVDHGVVTLSGVVEDEDLRARAVKLAEEVPGVVSVQDRIQVAGSNQQAD